MCKYYMQFWKAVLFYIITCEENLEGDASIHSWLKNKTKQKNNSKNDRSVWY